MLESIDLPSSVTSIDGYAFYCCSNLASITIPAGLECVWNGTFEGCSGLKSIVLLTPQIKFGDRAFHDCTSLESIYFGVTGRPTGYIEGNNSAVHSAVWYYYSESAPTEDGDFWHYVDGEPTPW
jgi:hypothetical protein